MFDDKRRILGWVTVMAVALAACDDGMSPGATATVQGSVEATSGPAPAGGPAASPSLAPGSDAESVAVVQVRGNGTFAELATASVEADGSFEIHGVPAGRSDLAVMAYAGGQIVGGVLIHETSRAGAVIVAAPINHETSVEAGAYSQVRAEGSGGSASELALLVHVQGASAAMMAGSAAEIEAVADGYLAASSAMTSVYTTTGTSFGASARAQALTGAAIQFSADRHTGMSLGAAHDAFTEAALSAYAAAGATLEQSVIASGAAASTFDAALYGHSAVRADIVMQTVRMNVRARERLAAQASGSAEASIANAVRVVLGQARVALALGGVVDLRGLIETTANTAANAAVDAAVQLMASGASSTVQAEVRARAEAALEAARLETRLETATTAQAAASAAAGYRAAVRAAVDAMIEAAGGASVNADVVTSLFIAACGSAYIR